MGKKLVVKGANFSINGIPGIVITWVFGYTDSQLVGARGGFISKDTYCLAPEDISSHSGEEIRFIKCYAATSGTISISECNINGSTPTISRTESHAVVRGTNIVALNTPITLSSSKTIGVSGKDILTFNSTGGTGWRFHNASSASIAGGAIPIDFGLVE
jgi:hypothetical protein